MVIEGASVEETYRLMQTKLHNVVPDVELRIKAELVYEINKLKKERGAIILGHNYMEPALFHTVCDFVGDSLELSRKAAEVENDVMIFCGVEFMAETAKVLSPHKTVLLPARHAGCSLASSITADDVRKLKAKYPGVPVVTYINTYADVKAETDVCCTSGNAAKVVQSLPGDSVIFIPDEYLAGNVAQETGKKLIFPESSSKVADHEPVMIGWRGRCEVHEQFSVEDVKNIRKQFPEAVVLAHPECPPEVVAVSDYSGSTSKMIQYVTESKAPQYVLLTECSMADNIAAEQHDKEMVRLCSIRCPHMNQITLEDVLHALRYNEKQIEVPEEVIVKARLSLERMLAIH